MEISRRASDGQLRACGQSIPCLHTFRRDRQRRLLAVKDKVRGHNSPRQRPRGSGHCLEQPAPTSGQIRVLSHQIDRAPRDEPGQHGFQSRTTSRQLINLRAGGRAEPTPDDQPIVLELPEAFRQDRRSNARQAFGEIREALRPGKQLSKQKQRPPFTDYVQRQGDWAELAVLTAIAGTGFSWFVTWSHTSILEGIASRFE